MKQCPRCSQTYSDDTLNFCLSDGELLTANYQPLPESWRGEDSPPTLILNDPRSTNPYNNMSAGAGPPAQWQQPQMQYRNYAAMRMRRGGDQTIPTIALILGILSIVMGCCYGGIWLGLPAAILGYIGMRNADNDSERYGGRGVAIAGLIMGVISLLGSIGLVIAIIANGGVR